MAPEHDLERLDHTCLFVADKLQPRLSFSVLFVWSFEVAECHGERVDGIEYGHDLGAGSAIDGEESWSLSRMALSIATTYDWTNPCVVVSYLEVTGLPVVGFDY